MITFTKHTYQKGAEDLILKKRHLESADPKAKVDVFLPTLEHKMDLGILLTMATIAPDYQSKILYSFLPAPPQKSISYDELNDVV